MTSIFLKPKFNELLFVFYLPTKLKGGLLGDGLVLWEANSLIILSLWLENMFYNDSQVSLIALECNLIGSRS